MSKQPPIGEGAQDPRLREGWASRKTAKGVGNYDAELELGLEFETHNVSWGDPYLMQSCINVLNSAFKSGAQEYDLYWVARLVRQAWQAMVQLDQNFPLVVRAQRATRALNRHNRDRKMQASRKQSVRLLNNELTKTILKDAPRFREIAKRLDLTTHQVRHILKPSKRKPRV